MSKKKQKKEQLQVKAGLYNGQIKIFNSNRIVLRGSVMETDDGNDFMATFVELFRWIDEENKESIMFNIFVQNSTLQIINDDVGSPVQLGLRVENLPSELNASHLH